MGRAAAHPASSEATRSLKSPWVAGGVLAASLSQVENATSTSTIANTRNTEGLLLWPHCSLTTKKQGPQHLSMTTPLLAVLNRDPPQPTPWQPADSGIGK